MEQEDSTRQMFDATCSNCGNPAQVPFQPTSDRPVYCRDCFRQVRGGRGGSTSGGGDRGDRPMYDATCAECGQPTQVPFKPTEGRPVYCREHYRKQSA